MAAPKRSRDKVNQLKREHFAKRLAELEAARAAVPEEEMEDWLLERTEEELRMLADPEQFLK
jgi:hypothetical protein